MRRQSGFTLIELLVVVLVVSVVAGAVLLSFSGVDRRQALVGEAERMAALVRLARDQAVLDGVELGLETSPEGYGFLAWDPVQGAWLRIEGNRDPLRPRNLPEGLRLDLTSEALPRLRGAADNPAGQTAGTGPEPEVLLLSSGEVTPFEAVFSTDVGRDGPRWLVLADGVQDPLALSPDAADGLERSMVPALAGRR